MGVDHTTSCDALFERADRAIADAVTTRAMVQAGLAEAWQRPVMRSAYKVPAEPVPATEGSMAAGFIEPWWSVARTLASARAVVRDADAELGRGWNHLLPAIETPLALLRK